MLGSWSTGTSIGQAATGRSVGVIDPMNFFAGDHEIGRELSTTERVLSGVNGGVGAFGLAKAKLSTPTVSSELTPVGGFRGRGHGRRDVVGVDDLDDLDYTADLYSRLGISAESDWDMSINAAGGRVFETRGPVTADPSHIEGIVRSAGNGPVTILTGAHGGRSPGLIVPEPNFYKADAKYFAKYPNVEVKDMTTLSHSEIQALREGPGTVIFSICNGIYCMR
jgi:hypothetical protein